MYILTYYDNDRDYPWLCFDTIEDGRAFLAKLHGYEYTSDEEGIDSEWLNVGALPDYEGVEFKGNIVPISRFTFKDTEKVQLFFAELANLSIPNQGLIQGATTIDAYSIPNEEIKTYVETREKTYNLVKTIFEERRIQAERAYHGSEDGEAIIYRKENKEDWHFLFHLDPCSLKLYNEGEKAIRQYIDSLLDEQ